MERKSLKKILSYPSEKKWHLQATKLCGSFYVSVKLPTYPSPKPTLILSFYLGQNVGYGEGYVGSFTKTQNDPTLLQGLFSLWALRSFGSASELDDTMMILDLEVGGSKLAFRLVSLDKGLYTTLSLFTHVYKWVPATPFFKC